MGLGNPGKVCGWALGTPGRLGVGHCRETLGLGTPGGVGHSRETLGLGTPGRLWGWALQGDSGVGHSRRPWVWALRDT